jgi:prepilin-type N-terminal cleavage/methylation domain-containing protein
MRCRRPAFTLVELLVVITIIGMLLAMTFPMLQATIAAARRQDCANRLRELLHASEVRQTGGDQFPALVERGPRRADGTSGQPLAWPVQLLEYVGQAPLGRTWTNPKATEPCAVAPVSAFVCPDDDTATGDQPLSYVINAGAIEDATRPNLANGLAFSRHLLSGKGPSRSQVGGQKNLAATILFTENLQAANWGDLRLSVHSPRPYDGEQPTSAREAQQFTGFVWNGLQINEGESGTDFDVPATAPNPRWARPSSNHPLGVNAAMCGGNVRFIHQTVERHVFQYLSVSDPKKAAAAGLDPHVANMIAPEDF